MDRIVQGWGESSANLQGVTKCGSRPLACSPVQLACTAMALLWCGVAAPSRACGQPRRASRRGLRAAIRASQAAGGGVTAGIASGTPRGSHGSVAAHSSAASLVAGEAAVDAAPALPRQGPAGLQQLLAAYDATLRARPVRTKALTSLVGFALGDAIAQGMAPGGFDAVR